MKFVRLIYNIIYFAFLLVLIFLASFVVNWGITAQTGTSNTGFTVWSVSDDSLGFNDAFYFYQTSIQANYTTYSKSEDQDFSNHQFALWTVDADGNYVVQEGSYFTADVSGPKYRCRNWISWTWYKESIGLGLDYAVDGVASLTSPIVLPTMNANNVAKYYGKDLVDFAKEIDKKYWKGYTNQAITVLQAIQTSEIVDSNINTYAKWIDEYHVVYDYMFKIAKYNAYKINSDGEYVKIYETYYNKFVGEDGTVNSNVTLLYYTIVLDIVITAWIVHQYPTIIDNNEYGELDVHGGILGLVMNRIKRRNRKNKKKKADNAAE